MKIICDQTNKTINPRAEQRQAGVLHAEEAMQGKESGREILNTDTSESSKPSSTLMMQAVKAALTNAGLVVNGYNESLVIALLENGMAADRDNLRQLLAQSRAYPDSKLDTLCLMNKNEIPVNSFSVGKMQEFLDGRQLMIEEFSGVLEDAVGLITDPDTPEAVREQLTAALNSSMGEASVDGSVEDPVGAAAPEGFGEIIEESVAAGSETGVTVNSYDGPVGKDSDESGGKPARADVQSILREVETELSGNYVPDETGEPDKPVDNEYKTVENYQFEQSSVVDTTDVEKNASPEKSTLPTEVTSDDSESYPSSTHNEYAMEQEVKTEIDKSSPMIREAVKKLKNLISLEPDKISRDSVDKLYERLSKTLKKVYETAEKNEGTSGLKEHSAQARKTLEFLHNIYEVFPHAEIPVRFKHGQTDAELYVYSDGRRGKIDPKNCSALLHLDMPKLGLLDIFVAVSGGKSLNIDFSAEDERSGILLKQDIAELETKLEAEGYSVRVGFSKEYSKKDVEAEKEYKESKTPRNINGFDKKC